MINVYYLETYLVDNIEHAKGEEYIHYAILEVEGALRKLIQDTTDTEHAGLVAVAVNWRGATAGEIAQLATLPAIGLPPHSMHVAALKSVDIATKKATVIRKWMGTNYEVTDCRVSLGALEAYQAGKIKVFNPAYPVTAPQNADCFVLVYFISENPYDEAIEIPVIVDKVVK